MIPKVKVVDEKASYLRSLDSIDQLFCLRVLRSHLQVTESRELQDGRVMESQTSRESGRCITERLFIVVHLLIDFIHPSFLADALDGSMEAVLLQQLPNLEVRERPILWVMEDCQLRFRPTRIAHNLS